MSEPVYLAMIDWLVYFTLSRSIAVAARFLVVRLDDAV